MTQIWTEGPEPDRLLNAFCSHCTLWFATVSHPEEFRKLEVDTTRSSGVRERFFCTTARDYGVELIDAAAHGTLTPWQEWYRDGLINQMGYHELESERIRRELNDYYDYQDGEGV